MWQMKVEEECGNREEQYPPCSTQIIDMADLLNMDIWLGGEIRMEVSPEGVILVTRYY